MLIEATDQADHQAVGAPQALEVSGVWSSRLAAVKHGRANAGLKYLPTHLWREVARCEKGWQFPELAPCHAALGTDSCTAASTGVEHVVQLAEGGLDG